MHLTTFITGGFWEMLLVSIHRHEVSEGFFVASVLFILTLPPSIPLWQVTLGISFGVVLDREMFGGTGKNFLNPALVGRAFLFFVYPVQVPGDTVWTSAGDFVSATLLGLAAVGGVGNTLGHGLAQMNTLLNHMQGSMDGASTLTIFIGGVVLLLTRIASQRIVAGVMLRMVAMSYLFNAIGSASNPMFAMPWYWRLVTGGFAFDMIFIATGPVSASITDTGKWLFGTLIGVMAMLAQVISPTFPEGMMLAVLFVSLFTPLIDHFVVQANIKRGLACNG